MPQPHIFKRTLHAVCQPLGRLRGYIPPETELLPVILPGLAAAWHGCRLAVVADVHLPQPRSSPAQIIAALRDAAPDILLLPGDLANRYGKFDAAGIAAFLRELARIAPCYAVTGNHEQCSPHLAQYRTLLRTAGVQLLENRWCTLYRQEQPLALYGMCDPHIRPAVPSAPSILLLHYPHWAAKLSGCGFSLAVCGHAHGGQICFGKSGLYAPGQGFFPKYVNGRYTVGGMQMIVSRGLGDSSLPLRIHNRPHIPVILLRAH